jgi:hypothetical protein
MSDTPSRAPEENLIIVDRADDWAAAIGKAFVAFGGIEHVTVVCLREIPRDKLLKATKSFRLVQRIDLLLEILEAYPAQAYRTLAGQLERAKELAETRNLIAHNPLVLEFYERPDGKLFHQQVIAAMHRDRKITLEELQAFADDSMALSAALYDTSSEVFRLRGSPAGA